MPEKNPRPKEFIVQLSPEEEAEMIAQDEARQEAARNSPFGQLLEHIDSMSEEDLVNLPNQSAEEYFTNFFGQP